MRMSGVLTTSAVQITVLAALVHARHVQVRTASVMPAQLFPTWTHCSCSSEAALSVAGS